MLRQGSNRLPGTRSLLRRVEERPISSVFFLALGARLVAAILIAVTSGPAALVPDSGSYQLIATQAGSGDTASWTAYEHELFERTGALLWPLTGLFFFLGPVVITGQLYVALFGAAAAAITTRLAFEVVASRRAAVSAGLSVGLMPSMILWSSVILKDAIVWAVLSALAVVVILAQRSSGRALLGCGIAAIILLTVLAYTRLHTLQIALVAVAIAATFGSARGRVPRLAGAFTVLALFPLAFGMGVGGASFVANAGSLEERRVNNAIAANSAIVEVPADRRPTVVAARQAATENAEAAAAAAATKRQPAASPAPQTKPAPATSPAATPKPKPTTKPTPGKPANKPATEPKPKPSTKPTTTPEPEPEPEPYVPDDAVGSQLSYVPTGLTVMVLRPFPWEAMSATSSSMKFAALESLLWYPIVLLALVGLWPVRHHLAVLAFPLLVLGGTMLMYALTEGNVGTAFRHRGEFVWVVAILAAMGAVQLNTLRASRRNRLTSRRRSSTSVA